MAVTCEEVIKSEGGRDLRPASRQRSAPKLAEIGVLTKGETASRRDAGQDESLTRLTRQEDHRTTDLPIERERLAPSRHLKPPKTARRKVISDNRNPKQEQLDRPTRQMISYKSSYPSYKTAPVATYIHSLWFILIHMFVEMQLRILM